MTQGGGRWRVEIKTSEGMKYRDKKRGKPEKRPWRGKDPETNTMKPELHQQQVSGEERILGGDADREKDKKGTGKVDTFNIGQPVGKEGKLNRERVTLGRCPGEDWGKNLK